MPTVDLQRLFRLAKESAWVVVGQFFVATAAFAQIYVLTRFVAPEDYGRLTLGLTATVLFGQLVFGGLAEGLGRYWPTVVNSQSRRSFQWSAIELAKKALLLALVLSAAILALVLLVAGPQWLGIASAACLLATLSGLNGLYIALHNAARHRKKVAIYNGLESLLRLGLVLCLAAVDAPNPVLILMAFSVATGTILVWQTVRNRVALRRPVDETESSHSKQWSSLILSYSWPFSIWGLFTFVQQSSDRWSLAMFGGVGQVGLYAVLFQLGYAPVMLLFGVFVALISPIVYQRFGGGISTPASTAASRLVRRLTVAVLGLTGALVFLASLLHPLFFAVMVPVEYQSISHLLPWLVFAAGVFSAGQTQSLELMGGVSSRRLLIPKVAVASLCTLGYLLVTGPWGIEGVVAVLNGAALVYLVWIGILCVRDGKLHA